MSAVRGKVEKGQVVVAVPDDWPDGTEVVVRLAGDADELLPDDEDVSPEAIARRLALMDRMEPVVMSEQELAEWEKARAEDKAWAIAHWDEHNAKIDKLFQ